MIWRRVQMSGHSLTGMKQIRGTCRHIVANEEAIEPVHDATEPPRAKG